MQTEPLKSQPKRGKKEWETRECCNFWFCYEDMEKYHAWHMLARNISLDRRKKIRKKKKKNFLKLPFELMRCSIKVSQPEVGEGLNFG